MCVSCSIFGRASLDGRGANARAWPPLVTPSFWRALVAPTPPPPLSASWQLRLSASPRLTSQCAPPAFAAFSPPLQRCRCWLPPLPAEGGGGGVATAPVAPPPVRPLFFRLSGLPLLTPPTATLSPPPLLSLLAPLLPPSRFLSAHDPCAYPEELAT